MPKTHNAKGVALFISGICNYWHISPKDKPELKKYLDRLIIILSDLKDPSINAWGYGFLWVARGGLRFPAGAPNVVVSYYVYSALEKVADTADATRTSSLFRLEVLFWVRQALCFLRAAQTVPGPSTQGGPPPCAPTPQATLGRTPSPARAQGGAALTCRCRSWRRSRPANHPM